MEVPDSKKDPSALPGNVRRIWVVDDEPDVAQVIVDTLTFVGFPGAKRATPDSMAGGIALDEDIVFLDLNMPGKDGLQVLREMSNRGVRPAVILVSGVDSRLMQAASNFANFAGFTRVARIQKPISLNQLRDAMESIFRKPAESRGYSNPLPVVGRKADTAPVSEFTPYFQPKVEIRSGRVKGFEALMRWRPSPDGPVLGPRDFLDEIRACHRMQEVTEHIVDVGLELLADWVLHYGEVGCAFNFEASLLSPDMVDHLTDACLRVGYPAKLVTVELTEREWLANSSAGLEALARLRLRGFQLSMDDFGTGYSSLNRLAQYPFSELKLDVGFVSRIGRDHDVESIIRESILLAHQMGMTVCAEGVEHVDQLSWLSDVNCDHVQGFLLGRPMEPSQVKDVLGRQMSLSQPFVSR